MGRSKRERGFPPDPEPLPLPVVDNHTHLDAIGELVSESVDHAVLTVEHALDARLAERTGRHDMVGGQLAHAAACGVDRVVQVGSDLPSIEWTEALLRLLDAEHALSTADHVVSDRPVPQTGADDMFGTRAVLGAVAIHPNEAVLHAGVREVGPDGLEPAPQPHHATGLDDAIARVAQVARDNPRVRAVGETGMDLFRTGPLGEQVQREAFRAHVALAKELGLAMQIHDRDAHAQVIEVLLADGAPERTVFHCYSGDAEMATLAAEHGWYLSFAGPVTYPKNDHLRAALRTVPLELVLVETDAPYLPPHPFRGRPNGPYVVAHTVRAMAEILQRPLEDVCRALSTNAERVYGSW
ncbi:TatD family hydrolase [Isoptericola halotolerans]|uniref:TatD DNase family protein n=1 Tax=Isoptericola halotolerans TaxID=300560 RepID=A0ABX2A3Y8_9MICO|nr:TatD family hydrolase [Isoptericola halotolerans]NOV97401.1 TatD DNase family protein [Isoptericola halotolerans]